MESSGKSKMNYDVVAHYAKFRKAVVADVPDDICLDGFDLNEDEKEYIIKGLPLLRNCIVSIYDSIIEYSKEQPKVEHVGIMTSNIIMKERLEARAYVDSAFLNLYTIMLNGEYDDDRKIKTPCTVMLCMGFKTVYKGITFAL